MSTNESTSDERGGGYPSVLNGMAVVMFTVAMLTFGVAAAATNSAQVDAAPVFRTGFAALGLAAGMIGLAKLPRWVMSHV